MTPDSDLRELEGLVEKTVASGTLDLIAQRDTARREIVKRVPSLIADLREARERLNTPELHDFAAGVALEAAHQRERWGSDHDDGKSPFDWFWLIGYLAQKAAASSVAGDIDKAKHHTISTAAALANWHAALSGEHTTMRPGIVDPEPARIKQPEGRP